MRFLNFSKITFLAIMFFGCNSPQEPQEFIIKNNMIILKSLVNSNKIGQFDFYKKIQESSDEEKLIMIKELIHFERDTSLSKPFISCYNKNLSQLYQGNVKGTTIEIEALFMINQIYFKNPFYFSPYPIIVDNSGKEVNNSASEMKNVFQEYKSWLNKVEKMGIVEAQKKNIVPLSNGNYKWIYGINVSPLSPSQLDSVQNW